jgi:O-antigen ligase
VGRHNPLADARLLGLAVLLMLPALLFSRFMPPWASPAALAGLAVLYGLRSLAVGRFWGHTPVDLPLLALLLTLPVGLWVSTNRAVTLPLTYAYTANLALFWTVAAQAGTPWLRHSGWALLLTGVAICGLVLAGAAFAPHKLPFISPTLYAPLPERWRAFWDQESFNPNISGGLLVLFWAATVALAWRGPTWPLRDTAKVAAVLLTGVLLLTQSRGALLAGLVGLLIITTVPNRRGWWLWSALAGLAAAATVRWGPDAVLQAVLGRHDLLGDINLQARQELWQRAALILRDHPLTGVGLGQVGPTIQQFYPTAIIKATATINHAHHIFLQTGAEMGLPGLLALATIYLSLLARLWPLARQGHGLALGLLGSLAALFTHGLVDAVTASPQVALVVWGLLGLMAAVSVGESNQDAIEPIHAVLPA